MNTQKRIAIVAHDDNKTMLIEWSYFNKNLLTPHEIIAAGNTANLLEGTLNKPVCKLAKESNGGYHQLASIISSGEADAIIFFLSEASQLENHHIKVLLTKALEANILIALNKTAADFILHSGLMNEKYLISPVNTGYSPHATIEIPALPVF